MSKFKITVLHGLMHFALLLISIHLRQFLVSCHFANDCLMLFYSQFHFYRIKQIFIFCYIFHLNKLYSPLCGFIPLSSMQSHLQISKALTLLRFTMNKHSIGMYWILTTWSLKKIHNAMQCNTNQINWIKLKLVCCDSDLISKFIIN